MKFRAHQSSIRIPVSRAIRLNVTYHQRRRHLIAALRINRLGRKKL